LENYRAILIVTSVELVSIDHASALVIFLLNYLPLFWYIRSYAAVKFYLQLWVWLDSVLNSLFSCFSTVVFKLLRGLIFLNSTIRTCTVITCLSLSQNELSDATDDALTLFYHHIEYYCNRNELTLGCEVVFCWIFILWILWLGSYDRTKTS